MFTDKASGKDVHRPQLAAMLGFVREGDVVYVHSMDRLALPCIRCLDANSTNLLLLALARCPMQYGHRVPRRERPTIVVCHSCPAGHCHHTRRFDPARRSFGSRRPLRLGCHCASNHATSRNHSASERRP